ncbi:hypothetical protein FB565_007535 [Actinoplanes lutulentus]|uniref:HEAT repeat protein n=1 Tax=Actinoplanes lutulentus TaxID=1287878 RepID=A0A327Z3R0_9ACTN|nr:hypothetical protein [Actinoplanes lutulentus]MBB2947764.1 hypothetical protein [Actinoplanes lutulentus]RAK29922.1 hypothetical protein B0I29_117248 [Actinoplanes lutulentus]
MRSTSRRPDRTDVIAWVVVGGIFAAIGAGVAHSVIDLARAALEAPLLMAACLTVSTVGYLVLRTFWRAPDADVVPPRSRDRLFLVMGVVLFLGGGVAVLVDGIRHGIDGAIPIFMGALGVWLGSLCVRALRVPAPVSVAEPAGGPDYFAAWPVRLELGLARHLLDDFIPLKDDAARAALRKLSTHPYLLDGLVHHARRGDLAEQLRLFAAAAVLPGAPPLACALASLDRNGYVRERAVRAMGRQPAPEFVPFLVERAVDAVEPVRAAALSLLRALIDAEPAVYQEALASAASRIERRRHAPAVLALISISGR